MTRITDMLKTVRRHIVKAETDSSDWRAVIDSLRPRHAANLASICRLPKNVISYSISAATGISARHRMPARGRGGAGRDAEAGGCSRS